MIPGCGADNGLDGPETIASAVIVNVCACAGGLHTATATFLNFDRLPGPAGTTHRGPSQTDTTRPDCRSICHQSHAQDTQPNWHRAPASASPCVRRAPPPPLSPGSPPPNRVALAFPQLLDAVPVPRRLRRLRPPSRPAQRSPPVTPDARRIP